MRPINLIAVICGILACLVWLSDSRAGDFKKWRIGAAGKASFVGGGTAGSIDSDFGSWKLGSRFRRGICSLPRGLDVNTRLRKFHITEAG